MNGKEKCRILKDIRRQIAEKNDIEWVVSECKHQGTCKGTCPKCESEVRKLERELSLRRKVGKTVAIAGISAACVAGVTGCSAEDVIETGETIIDNIREYLMIGNRPIEVEGEIEYIPDDDLSGYVEIETEPETEPEIIELDGEVPADYWD